MRFEPGKTGNPNGRPKGSGHRQKVFNALVVPHQDKLFETAISLALNGNETMLRLFLERMMPAKPVDEPVEIKLPENITNAESLLSIGENILRGIEAKTISPEQGKNLLDIVKSYRENIILDGVLEKAKEIEEKVNNHILNKSVNTL